MKRIDEIIVVEGRDDTDAVTKSVDAVTIETHGYGIRQETWEMLDRAYESKGLIIFTDPDPAGERIRRRLLERYPKAKEAFLDQSDAEKDGDIGIENASPQAIEKALTKAHGGVAAKGATEPGHAKSAAEPGHAKGAAEPGQPAEGTDEFTMQDMDKWGLNGNPGASERRRVLGRELGIGFAGCRTFLKRLNRFGITKKEIETLIEDLDSDRVPGMAQF